MAQSTDSVELSGVKTVVGAPDEVRKALSGVRAQRVIALTIEHASEPAARALEGVMKGLAPLVGKIVEARTAKAFRSIVEALVSEVSLPPSMIVEARMTAAARKATLESGSWLTSAEIANAAGFSAVNPSAQPNKWKREKQIFAVRHQGADYFPGYALDPSTGCRPAKGLAKVLAAFEGRKDDWALAYWFSSANSFLGGKRPQDLLISAPDSVLKAAEDEMAGVLHG